jgi:hypothetical protein
MTTTVVAILMLDGRARMCCLGCTTMLAELGMVRAIGEMPMRHVGEDGDVDDENYVATTYEIAEPYTLENCRAIIRDRHVGPAWGS